MTGTSDTNAQGAETRIRGSRRYWRRVDKQGPWWPWGLLPLLGLVILFLYGVLRTAPHIQADVASEVAGHLRANNIAVTDVSTDGQRVSIRAGAPQDQDSQIRALAKSTECDTWAGRLTCPTTVQLALVAPAETAPDLASAPAHSFEPRAHDFMFIRTEEDEVILTGEVPDDFERRSIVKHAHARFGRVTDRLSISNHPATDQYALAADRALAVLDKFKRGQANWTNGVFEASGLASAQDAEVARKLFNETPGRPNSGEIRIQVAAAEPMPSAPALADVRRAHDFSFSKTGGQVTLKGEVPDDARRQGIVQLANARFAKVVDELSVSNQSATEQYPLAADRALAVLGRLKSGQATWTNSVFEASGVANAKDAEAARSLFYEASRKPNTGQIEIQIADEMDRCNKEFRQVLSETTIHFRTASAEIDDGNEALLQRLANLASECPGRLSIEGHTDDRGNADLNQKLSLARAQAVRDALVALGVDAERLTAHGYGESQPLFDNNTVEGRARNRRIVLSITN